jgi:tRNA(Ile)-lysidine synthase
MKEKASQVTLQEGFQNKTCAFLSQNTSIERIVLALSGGLDSVVLLQLTKELLASSPDLNKNLIALHVNHDISQHSDSWQTFCEELCEGLGVPLHTEKLNFEGSNNLEARAREARYAIFENFCTENDVVLSAHHKDDQAETILFRLFRGNGGKSLSGIPEKRPLGKALLFRPLLQFNKKILEAYAKENELDWVKDESNSNLHFSRNYIRHEILPRVLERWPQFHESLERVARLRLESVHLLQEVAEQDFQALLSQDPDLRSWGDCIELAPFKKITRARQKNILRYWMSAQNLLMPSEQRLESLVEQISTGGSEANQSSDLLHWKQDESIVSWKRFEGCLFLLINKSGQETGLVHKEWDLREGGELVLPQWRFCAAKHQKKGESEKAGLRSDVTCLKVVYRKGGERCQPVSRANSQTLKKLLQEYRVPPWERDYLPLFHVDEKLVSVADLWVCKGYESREEDAWLISRSTL